MTLIEALVSLAIAFGVIASAVDATRLVIARSMIARLHTEAELNAELELSRVGHDLPLRDGNFGGVTGTGLHWAVKIDALEGPVTALQAFRVSSDVTVDRAGVTARANLTTLELNWAAK